MKKDWKVSICDIPVPTIIIGYKFHRVFPVSIKKRKEKEKLSLAKAVCGSFIWHGIGGMRRADLVTT